MDSLKSHLLGKSSKFSKSKSKPTSINQKLDPKFKDGLELGNKKQVKKYLDKHPHHVNVKFSWNGYPAESMTPLHIASCGRNTEVLDPLLEKHADVNQLTESGKNALHFSALFPGCNDSIINILVNKGIDINHVDNLGNTPLKTAVESNNVGVVRKLLHNSADRTIDGNDNATLLKITESCNKYSTLRGVLSKNRVSVERYEEMKNELQNTKEEIRGVKAEFSTNFGLLQEELRSKNAALSKSQETLNQLVQFVGPCISNPGFRNSLAGYPTVHESLQNSPRARGSWSPASPKSDDRVEEQDLQLRSQDFLNDDEGPIGPNEKFNIQRNFGNLTTCIKNEQVLTLMFESMLITPEVKEHIESIPGNSAKNNYILMKVVLPGSMAQLRTFLQILEKTGQKHVASAICGTKGRVLYHKPVNSSMQYSQQRKFTQSDSILYWANENIGSFSPSNV